MQNRRNTSAWKSVCFSCILPFFSFILAAQCTTTGDIYHRLLSIEGNDSLTDDEKLKDVNLLKKEFDACGFVQDSTYARLLHRSGILQYKINNNIPTASAIECTLASVRINTSSRKETAKRFAVNSYSNLGYFYKAIKSYNQALAYFDTAIQYNKQYPEQSSFTMNALDQEAEIYSALSDHQKCVETCLIGIAGSKKLRDTAHLMDFLRLKAIANNSLGKYQSAITDADSVLHYIRFHCAGNNIYPPDILKVKAKSYAGLTNFADADKAYIQTLQLRKQENEIGRYQLVFDYIEYGDYLSDKQDYAKAKDYFTKAISLLSQYNDNYTLARTYNNLAQTNFRLRNFKEAEHNYNKSFAVMNVSAPDNFLLNTTTAQLSLVTDKDLLINSLSNKAELLLALYKDLKQPAYLRACLQTALLTDTVVTGLRHEQLGEQSKLYWRNMTRSLFNNALEACYLANDKETAFYFMEESRSVMLSDKLNELNSTSTYLPATEIRKAAGMQANIIAAKQQLSFLQSSSKEYSEAENKLYLAKIDLEHYIKLLEKKYPLYYQYKYADYIPDLPALQDYIKKNNQSLVYYFTTDTVMYVLAITKSKTDFIKLSVNDFNSHQLSDFINLCSNKQAINNNYKTFASLSQSIYKHIFEPLHLPKGNVAICTDNFFIPFEALCSDEKGKQLLLYDYNFSYVYSARSLLKPFAGSKAAGNFIGFAPVSFSSGMQVFPLLNSSSAAEDVASCYSGHRLFTQQQATRSNFFNEAAKYSVVTIFSHAQADTTDKEPVLYMQDSLIHLSELGMLRNPSIQFVLLSACQTNIGKNATGEGIYSLARGFAAAGVPSMSATLWKADEEAVYRISFKFNEYLAKGMNKSEALQKAKIWYLQNSDHEHLLPYYWANMVLIGSSQPISVTSSNPWWRWVAFSAAFAIAVLFVLYVLVYKERAQQKNYGRKL